MLQTTGIGSLPHTQREMAIQFSFRADIPYLPEMPQTTKFEYMIPLALDGIPGYSFDESGMPVFDEYDWGFFKKKNTLLLISSMVP